MIILTDEVILAAARLKELRALSSEIEREERQVRGVILAAIEEDEHQMGVTGSGARVCHVVKQFRRGVNREKLEAMFPTVFEQVVEENEVLILKID